MRKFEIGKVYRVGLTFFTLVKRYDHKGVFKETDGKIFEADVFTMKEGQDLYEVAIFKNFYLNSNQML